MAVDTAAKRYSIVSPTLPWRSLQTPPDNASSAGDREALLYLYSGIAAGAGDSTAPILSNPTVGSVTSSGGTPAVDTDEGNGTIYMVVVPDGDLPSDTQIKAGQQSSGAAALASENLPVVGTGTQTFSAVTGLNHSTAYDVWFLHRDAAGNDSIAVLAEFTTAALAAPSPPASVVALGRNESIRVNWSASATAESYSVKWGTVDGGPYGNSQTGITDLTYLIPNLTNGTPYYIVVSATNAAGEGANSSQVSATPAVQSTTGGKLRLASHLVYSILKRPWQ